MRFGLLGLSTLLVVGCVGSPIKTYTSSESDEGVIYSLPRTILEIKVVVTETPPKDQQPSSWSVALAVTPHHVADPEKQFVLRRSNAWFFDDDVNFSVAPNGLLSSVATVVEDKTLDSIGSLLEAGIGVIKLKSFGGLGAFKIQSQADANPMEFAEQYFDAEVAKQLRPLVGTHRRHWALPSSGPVEESFSDFPAPGWNLDVKLVRADQIGPPASTPPAGGKDVAAPGTPSDGIFVRGLEPYVVVGELKGQLKIPETPNLGTLQAEFTADAAKNAQDKEDEAALAKALYDSIDDATSDPAKAAKQALARAAEAATQASRDNRAVTAAFQQLRNRIQQAIVTTATKRGAVLIGTDYELKRQARVQQSILVADYTPITRLPLNRALFVKATENVTLANGIVSNHKWNRPSSFAALAAFPVTVVERLVKVPNELIQLKFDVASKELELSKKLAEIERELSEPTATGAENENAYLNGLALAIHYKSVLDELASDATPEQRQAARLSFVTAAITANAAARKVGKAPPFPGIEQL